MFSVSTVPEESKIRSKWAAIGKKLVHEVLRHPLSHKQKYQTQPKQTNKNKTEPPQNKQTKLNKTPQDKKPPNPQNKNTTKNGKGSKKRGKFRQK